MTSQEMMRTRCPDGHCFYNVAAVDEAPDWRIVVAQPTADPNDDRIFGYDRDDFMARQYR